VESWCGKVWNVRKGVGTMEPQVSVSHFRPCCRVQARQPFLLRWSSPTEPFSTRRQLYHPDDDPAHVCGEVWLSLNDTLEVGINDLFRMRVLTST
jgi:hypothetical protein